MGIRVKIYSITGSVFLISCLVIWAATVTLVQSEYIKLEAENVQEDTARTVDALNNRVSQLDLKIPDWSSWDDAYQYSQDHNQAFLDSNVQNLALKNLTINFMLFFGVDQKLIFGIGVDVLTGDSIPIPTELSKALEPGSQLLATTETSSHKGLIQTSTYPLILTTRPFLHSDGSGPVGGTLVFASYLTPDVIASINDLTHLSGATFDSATNPNGTASDVAIGTSDTLARTHVLNSQIIHGYQLVNDVYGRPLLVAHITEPRTIFQKTQQTLLFYMAVVLSISLVSILITTYTTGKIAIQKRLIKDSEAVNDEIEKQVIDRTSEVKVEQARLSASINSLEIGFLITNSNYELVTINHAARKLLRTKLKNKETAHFTMDNIIQLLDNIDLLSILKSCLTDHKVVNIKELDYGGKLLRLFAGPILIRSDDGKTTAIGCVVLLEDTTEATVAIRSKDEFFSIASHELRTPLAAIRGNSSMMMQYYKDTFKDPDLKEMLVDINESSIRLITIVNDFLDVSRIEQGKIKYTYAEVTISKIIENVVQDMKSGQSENHVQIIVDHEPLAKLPTVMGDSDRVKQIVYNLVGNAVKFTDKGSVTIKARKVRNMLKITITDTGKGIDSEGQKLLFHKFQQADTSILTRATAKGTGLGLYISKLLVEGMGGDIALEHSKVGVGSTFSFTLPIATNKLKKNLNADKIKVKTELNVQTGLTS